MSPSQILRAETDLCGDFSVQEYYVMLPEPHSPRTGLALSDLQSTSSSDGTVNTNVNHNSSNAYLIGGGVISGLAISSHGSSSWSTRGVGGIGAGLSSSNSIGGMQGGGFFGGCNNQSAFGVGSSNQMFGGSSSSAMGCGSGGGLFKK